MSEELKVSDVKCRECQYCRGWLHLGYTRTEYSCFNPDWEYIEDYFKMHRITKMPGLIGYSAPYGNVPKIKTSPAWCPFKKKKNNGR